MIPRHFVAAALGRRVSRGEYERILTGYRAVPVKRFRLPDDRIVTKHTCVLIEGAPKWQRKHGDTKGVERSRRARFLAGVL